MANTQCTSDQIKTNTCKFDVNEALCIKGACDGKWYDASKANNPDILVQDIFLTATMLIGTVVTIVLVVSGIRYIMAWGSMGNAADAKKWIQRALIGLVIVTFSYTIVRVIQYVVAGYK